MKNKPFKTKDTELIGQLSNLLLEVLQNRSNLQSHMQPLYDSADVKRILNVSDKTLYRLRVSGVLPYFKLGKKIYYPQSFFPLLEKSLNF